MIISDDLLKRILADMRLASADKHGARRMLIHELEAAMAAGTRGGQEPSAEAVEVARMIEWSVSNDPNVNVANLAHALDAFAARKVAEAVAQERERCAEDCRDALRLHSQDWAATRQFRG